MNDEIQKQEINGIYVYLDTPFFGEPSQISKMSSFAFRIINEINNANSIRHIVIEYWLLIDHFVTISIGSFLDIYKNDTEELDLLNKVLPWQFEKKIELLRRILKDQRSLTPNPNLGRINASTHFIIHLQTRKPNLFNELKKAELEFFGEERLDENKRYIKNSHWLETMGIINEEWFNWANKVNELRNISAHSIDDEAIYKRFGLNGKKNNRVEKAKKNVITEIEKYMRINLV